MAKVVDILMLFDWFKSKSEARRAIKQGAIKVMDIKILSDKAEIFLVEKDKLLIIDRMTP